MVVSGFRDICLVALRELDRRVICTIIQVTTIIFPFAVEITYLRAVLEGAVGTCFARCFIISDAIGFFCNVLRNARLRKYLLD